MAVRDTKSRIYEAALDLMGRRGIAETSTRDILDAVGIKNPSAISYHFGSKAGLVEEIAAELAGRPVPDPGAGRSTMVVERVALPDRDGVGPAGHRHRRSARDDRAWVPARPASGGSTTATSSPQSLERFVARRQRLVSAVACASSQVFPDLPPQIGSARNVTMLRTIGWMLARMAQINLQYRAVRGARTTRTSAGGSRRSR